MNMINRRRSRMDTGVGGDVSTTVGGGYRWIIRRVSTCGAILVLKWVKYNDREKGVKQRDRSIGKIDDIGW